MSHLTKAERRFGLCLVREVISHASLSAAMTQQMECAEVRFGQSLPPFATSGRSKVARRAAGETFAVVVDLDQSLLAMIAPRDLVIFRH